MAAAEQKKSYKVIKQFRGVNTKANRTALEDGEFSWLENAMPIGYANIKTVAGERNTAVTFGNVASALLSTKIISLDSKKTVVVSMLTLNLIQKEMLPLLVLFLIPEST